MWHCGTEGLALWDRRPQGCGCRAYKDVFTACPGVLNPSSRSLQKLKKSMTEMTHPGKHHRHTMLIRRCDHFFIAHGTARLNHRCNTYFRGIINTVTEREKCIGSHHRTSHLQTGMFRFNRCDTCRVHTAHLACA